MKPDDPFLQAILTNPEDDGLRLVYADWLEEQGDSDRAEFIRVQYALESMSPGDSRRRAVSKRELELIRKHKEEWFAVRKAFLFWECRRGFIDEVNAHARPFLEHADELFGAHPVRRVQLQVSGAEEMAGVATCSFLGRLASLTLSGLHLGEGSLEPLSTSRSFESLTVLNLSGTQVGDSGARALAASPHLGRLRTLRLGGCGITGNGARALAASRSLTGLEDLVLQGNPISPDAVAALRTRFGEAVEFERRGTRR